MNKLYIIIFFILNIQNIQAQSDFYRRFHLFDQTVQEIETLSGGRYVMAVKVEVASPDNIGFIYLNDQNSFSNYAQYTLSLPAVIRIAGLAAVGDNLFCAFTFADSSNLNDTHAGWLLLDPSGNILAAYQFKQLTAFNSLRLLPDGLLLSGKTGTADQDGLLVKVKTDGQLDWYKVFGNTGNQEFNGCVTDAAGLIYCTGTHTSLTNTDALIAQFNQTGNLNWTRTYGTSAADRFDFVELLDAQRILAAGATEGFSTSGNKLWLTAIPLGNDLTPYWSYTYEYAQSELVPTDITPLPGNGYVLTAGKPKDVLFDSPGILFGLDAGGGLLWNYRYRPTVEGTRLHDVDVSGNRLILAGSNISANATDALALRTGLNGRLTDCPPENAPLLRAEVKPQADALNLTEKTVQLDTSYLQFTQGANFQEVTDLLMPIDVNLTVDPDTLCPGECALITLSGDTPGATYEPVKPGGATPDPFTPGKICFPKAGLYRLTRTARLDGCSKTDTALVNVQIRTNSLQPNAFSPNNDTHNDVFMPEFVCRPVAFLLEIYNRWGDLVFTSEDINTGWDGLINGQPAPADLYMWHVTYSGSDAPDTRQIQYGPVTLLR